MEIITVSIVVGFTLFVFIGTQIVSICCKKPGTPTFVDKYESTAYGSL